MYFLSLFYFTYPRMSDNDNGQPNQSCVRTKFVHSHEILCRRFHFILRLCHSHRPGICQPVGAFAWRGIIIQCFVARYQDGNDGFTHDFLDHFLR